jgi:hypothetical protein
MASPGLSDPVVATQEHSTSIPGHAPGTFRPAGFHDSGQAPQPGLGTLSVATVLAVAVAAMRGINGAITGVRANREQRRAAADLAASGRGDGTGGRKGRVQSAADFGRGFLGRPDRAGGWFRSGGGSGGRGGGGGGRGGFGSFGGWGGGSSSPRTGSRRASGFGADGTSRRRNSGGGSGGGSGSASGSRSGGWWRGGSKRTSQGGTGGRRSKRGGTGTGADVAPGTTTGTGGASPKGGRKGRAKSPKAGIAPKGTLRPNKAKKGQAPGTAGGQGAPGTSSKKAKKGAPAGTGGPGTTAAPGKAKKGKNGTSATGRSDTNPKHNGAAPAAPAGPVGLRQAIGNEFERRWAERRKHGTPVIGPLSKKARRKAAAKKKRKPRSAATATAAGPKVNLTKNQNPKAKVRKNPKHAGSPPPRPGAAGAGAPGPGPGGPSKHTRHGGGHWSREQRRAQQRWEQRRAAHAAPDDDFWFVWGPNGIRRTPWQSAGAAAAAAEPETITIERLDKPGDQEPRRWGPTPASNAAVLGSAAQSSSTGRKETGSMSLPDRVMSGLVTGMSSEHATEVTLDDTLETLERLTVESFAAHETCTRLAEEARQIRYRLEDLAADLRTRHNVIGRMTAAAMERLAESMELLARKAEEMRVSSLDAAEVSEAAENAMFDAYKPVQQATADAGLLVPSARIHNKG